jgi:hypothetical protein
MDDHDPEIRAAALSAALRAGAVEKCDYHPEELIWRLDDSADADAMRLAMERPRADGTFWEKADMRSAIRSVLEEASEGVCQKCG